MKRNWTYTILRTLAALLFIFSGIMKFFPLPQQSMGPALDSFFAGMLALGYFIPLVAICEIIPGLMFLFNFRSALASLILLPLTVNIFLINVIFMPQGWFVGVIVFLLNIYFLYVNREKYSAFLKK